MRRCLGFIAFLLALTLLIPLSVSATEYIPSTYLYGLYATGETYTGYLDGSAVTGATGRNTNGTFTVPLNLNSRFNRVYLTARYPSVTYDVGAEYKFVISITLGATGSLTNTNVPFLYSTNPASAISSHVDVKNAVLISQKGSLSVSNNNTYTFTYDSIKYDSVVGNNTFSINFLLSYFTSSDPLELYIVNSYFGLESYYDEDKYNSQIIDALGNIQGGINDANDKLDGIQDSLDNFYDDEKEHAKNDADSATNESDEAAKDLPDFSDSYIDMLGQFSSVLTSTDVSTEFPLPDGEVDIFGVNIDFFAGQSGVDLSMFLDNEWVGILIVISKAFSVIGCMATCVYWANQLREWITSDSPNSTPSIPMMPKGGAEH